MGETLSFEPPRGMRDFYPEDMAWRNRVFDAFRAAGEAAGFSPYDSCVVESYDLLARKAGEEVGEQIYHFFDKSERHIALRPQCFRYERMTKGRKREHYQWNVDIVGEDSVLAEAEVLGAACDALRRMGLSTADFRVHVSSRRLLGEVLERSGVPADRHAQVFLALDKRGKMPDAEIAAMLRDGGLDDALVAKVFEILSLKDLDSVVAYLGAAAEGSRAVAELSELFRLAGAAGFAESLVFDIGVIRGLSYYTGIVFECFDAKGEFRAIFGGGRYDNLLTAIGGMPMSAVGLGFGDVVVTELLKSRLGGSASSARKGVAVGFMEDAQRDAAVRLAARLRREGKSVDLALHAMKPKKFFAHAGSSMAAEAVFLGPDDVEKGAARLKNLETREEAEISL